MIPDGTLTDTGPLFALADAKGQPEQFRRCSSLLLTLPTPMVTTWPCFAEVMHLTGREGGWAMRKLILDYVVADLLRLHAPSGAEIVRIMQLMEQYRDRPMDLADVSLVALAEAQGYTRLFRNCVESRNGRLKSRQHKHEVCLRRLTFSLS